MSQIVKRKKKGRPSKADLARRDTSSPPEPTYELRRSHRRRNVTYNFDFDDFLDEDEEEEAEDERRREKKVKLMLKLNQAQEYSDSPTRGRGRPPARRRPAEEDDDYGKEDEDEDEEGEGEDAEEEEEEDDSEKKPAKRRKINEDDEEERDYDGDGGGHGSDEGEEDEERARRGGANLHESVSGSRREPHSETPMPADKKSLELILDKLQKKDIYGVYAEPVDPEELPDYHDIIEHPMDFSTVRKKLADGSYPTFEHFESDVFLICSNAMQYNSPDTVYYKQARTIQEMARKKFEKVRERTEKELKSKPNSTVKKQMKKPFIRSTQEAFGSDFSSGAELATGDAIQNGHMLSQTGGFEKRGTVEIPAEFSLSILESNLERAEELSSGKGLFSKLGKKPSVVDENRRASYELSNLPVDRSDSIFRTFEAEIKQLVAVGLHAENSYSRSLARFAAMLGPLAWKFASQRIEQALPAGVKFGRGWVGEYEPLPMPVLTLGNQGQKECKILSSHSVTSERRDEIPSVTPMHTKEQPTGVVASEGNPSTCAITLEGNPPLFNYEKKVPFVSTCEPRSATPVIAASQRQKFSWNNIEPLRQMELNLPPSTNQSSAALAPSKQGLRSEIKAPKSRENVSRHASLVKISSTKQVESNGIVHSGTLNGAVSSFANSRMISLSSDNASAHVAPETTSSSQQLDQGANSPVYFMRVLTDQERKQQNAANQPQVETPSIISSGVTMRKDDSTNAAAAAARAWMSVGAGGGLKQTTENSSSHRNQISAESLYNPARDFHTQTSRLKSGEVPFSSGLQFRPQRSNNYSFQAFMQQPPSVNGTQSQYRPIVFPQFATSDNSRFSVQPPWRGISPNLSHIPLKAKQDNLPPDLNIVVQSPDSPAKQSSSVRVDSQQPDLALQL